LAAHGNHVGSGNGHGVAPQRAVVANVDSFQRDLKLIALFHIVSSHDITHMHGLARFLQIDGGRVVLAGGSEWPDGERAHIAQWGCYFVSQRQAQRDLKALEEYLGVPFHLEANRWIVDRAFWLQPLRFSLAEATGLLLSARLMLRHSDHGDEFTASAYEKLAAVLPEPIRDTLVEAAAGMSGCQRLWIMSFLYGVSDRSISIKAFGIAMRLLSNVWCMVSLRCA